MSILDHPRWPTLAEMVDRLSGAKPQKKTAIHMQTARGRAVAPKFFARAANPRPDAATPISQVAASGDIGDPPREPRSAETPATAESPAALDERETNETSAANTLVDEASIAAAGVESVSFEAPATAAAPSQLTRLLGVLAEEAAYCHVFSADSKPFSVGKGVEHSLIVDQEPVRLKLSKGIVRGLSGGHTEGYGVRLPDELEKAASGRKITVSVLARAVEPSETQVACSYSTNDVGNSGWRWFKLTPEWAIYSFDYPTPVMNKGNGDFLGLMPQPEPSPAAEVAGFAIRVHDAG